MIIIAPYVPIYIIWIKCEYIYTYSKGSILTRCVTYLKGFVTEAALPASHQSVMKVHIENGVEELPPLLALGEQVALKQLILSRLL